MVAAAMATFSCSDTLSKHLSQSLPALEIAWLRWVGFVILMTPLLVAKRGAPLRSRMPVLQVLRSIALVASTVFFMQGLRDLPLASAAAISFVAPLVVTALSIPLLGEKVGARRWAAVTVGFLGVLLVIQPGTGTFGWAAVFPVLSAVAWAFGMIATRKVGMADGAGVTMTYAAFVGLAALTVLLPFHWVTPTLPEVGLACAMAVASTAAQLLVVLAYRLASASVLAPISYSQLVWSGLLGFFVFGSIPDAATFAGAAVIIGSGLYTAHRERVVARETRAATGQ